MSRLKRKYGGSIESALEHLARAEDSLRHIERSDEREARAAGELQSARAQLSRSLRGELHGERVRAAKKFERAVERDLAAVAMEHARFVSRRYRARTEAELADEEAVTRPLRRAGLTGWSSQFSANVGEAVRPLARVASGGEASRLMLVLKTIANASEFPRTIVFDEIDTGIGGRVSEAVGVKLKKLSETNQVFCVTHQPQIARFADSHLLVRKEVVAGRTEIEVERLDSASNSRPECGYPSRRPNSPLSARP